MDLRSLQRLARRSLAGVTAVLLLLSARSTPAYSLLTHEQLIDLTWQDSIQPLLLRRFPHLTSAQLVEARSYAYGGCVIQDIGYYPFGDAFYSDLTHYVRPGDFIVNLLREARNADELAFAIGALSHYIGDTIGHPEATNVAVPVVFPELGRRFGPSVSYAEGEHQHVRTEFAFDIDEIAHGRLAPYHYLQHIGLNVPVDQLSRAFYDTYGISEDFTQRRGRRVNVSGYRFATRTLIPRFAFAVTLLHRKHLPPDSNSPQFLELQQRIQQVSQSEDWQRYRHKAGIGTHSLAALVWVLPKFGPLSILAVKGPTADTEEQYVHSVLDSMLALQTAVNRLGRAHETLRNLDLDTGQPTRPGRYRLADDTYADLLRHLAADPKASVPPGLKQEVNAFYADPNAPIATRRNPRRWAQVQADLKTLQGMPVSKQPIAAETEDPVPITGDVQPSSR